MKKKGCKLGYIKIKVFLLITEKQHRIQKRSHILETNAVGVNPASATCHQCEFEQITYTLSFSLLKRR